jgi:hypothetical protein
MCFCPTKKDHPGRLLIDQPNLPREPRPERARGAANVGRFWPSR